MIGRYTYKWHRESPGLSAQQGEQHSPSFVEQSVRKSFIRRVYSIILVQSLISFGFICLFQFCKPLKEVTSENQWIMWVTVGLVCIMIAALCCIEELRRKSPINLIMLVLVTLVVSVFLGVVSVVEAPDMVFMAVGLTSIIVCVLIFYAMQTKVDFTLCGSVALTLLVLLILLSLIVTIFPTKTLDIIYSSLGVLFYSLYLLTITQMMMGDKGFDINPAEHVCAAILLYLGIVALFLCVFGCFNSK